MILTVEDDARWVLTSYKRGRMGPRTRTPSSGASWTRPAVAMPREFSSLIEQLQVVVALADQLCRDGRFLTLASPSDVPELRAWMTHEIVAQVTRGATPTPWAEWHGASS